MKNKHSKHGQRPATARQPADFRERDYRRLTSKTGLYSFQVVCQETDLMIQADKMLEQEAREQVLACRAHIENYIQRHPAFATSLQPWPDECFAPLIIRQMITASQAAGVGPMAAVAGAIAENVGQHLLGQCSQIIVENGGDIFLKTDDVISASLFAGDSPLSMRMGIKIPPAENGVGVCTSSGTVGHSLSKGSADAVCVVSPSCALADAVATAIGNRVHNRHDIKAAIDFGKTIAGVSGIVVVMDREMGAWGSVELVPVHGKKG